MKWKTLTIHTTAEAEDLVADMLSELGVTGVEVKDRRQILAAAKKAFRGQYDAKTISGWLDVFFRRFFSQAFKRNCAPDGVQVFSVYLSPAAWHVPSDISAFEGLR